MPVSDKEYFRYLPIGDYDKRWGVYVTGVGCTNVPPLSKSYLQIRMHRAKEMLLGTLFSIKEIAAMLHFETPFHFSAVFKKKTGMSPSRWRSGCD